MITFDGGTWRTDDTLIDAARAAQQSLHDGTCPGSDFRGWLDLPATYPQTREYARLKDVAREIRREADALVVVGIGGSYLGARAVIHALTPLYRTASDLPTVYFAGKNISATELAQLRDVLATKKNVYINVISKSGTTLEPALAFRVLRADMEKRYGVDGARMRIIATTDGAQGALHDDAAAHGYGMFVVPDDVGGRYSVLTAVGLLPIAVAGIDVDALMAGAAAQRAACMSDDAARNDCLRYAATRTALYNAGKNIDVFATYEPRFAYIAEWWKQLFGESEGKDGKGLFPASMMFTTDLHSLGQYMQEGRRTMCETVLAVAAQDDALTVPPCNDARDGLDAYVGMSLGAINAIAQDATIAAHEEGGVPVMKITMPAVDARGIGAALYFFEYACAISALMLGVNPFNQPGVEVYKKKMYDLLARTQ